METVSGKVPVNKLVFISRSNSTTLVFLIQHLTYFNNFRVHEVNVGHYSRV